MGIENDKPGILDISPGDNSGIMKDEMVPEGIFADLDIMEEQLIEYGLPPGIVGSLKEKMIKDPSFKEDIERQVRIWMEQENKDGGMTPNGKPMRPNYRPPNSGVNNG